MLDTQTPPWGNDLVAAAAASGPAHEVDRLFALARHARIARSSAKEFWLRVEALFAEFNELPREGDEVYGLVAGLYPTQHPTLPPTDGTD